MTAEIELTPFVRGDTWTNKFTFKDTVGDPIDITGRTYWMTLKLDPESPDLDADAQKVAIASGIDATDGVVYIVFTPEDTETLTPATYYYDVQEVVDTNTVITVMTGRVKVLRDITRSR